MTMGRRFGGVGVGGGGVMPRLRDKRSGSAMGGGTLPAAMGGTMQRRGDLPSYKKGGRVKKTGMAMLHAGEKVLTKRQAKRIRSKGGRSKGRY